MLEIFAKRNFLSIRQTSFDYRLGAAGGGEKGSNQLKVGEANFFPTQNGTRKKICTFIVRVASKAIKYDDWQ